MLGINVLDVGYDVRVQSLKQNKEFAQLRQRNKESPAMDFTSRVRHRPSAGVCPDTGGARRTARGDQWDRSGLCFLAGSALYRRSEHETEELNDQSPGWTINKKNNRCSKQDSPFGVPVPTRCGETITARSVLSEKWTALPDSSGRPGERNHTDAMR